jgi:hypothetical protein
MICTSIGKIIHWIKTNNAPQLANCDDDGNGDEFAPQFLCTVHLLCNQLESDQLINKKLNKS